MILIAACIPQHKHAQHKNCIITLPNRCSQLASQLYLPSSQMPTQPQYNIRFILIAGQLHGDGGKTAHSSFRFNKNQLICSLASSAKRLAFVSSTQLANSNSNLMDSFMLYISQESAKLRSCLAIYIRYTHVGIDYIPNLKKNKKTHRNSKTFFICSFLCEILILSNIHTSFLAFLFLFFFKQWPTN